MRRSTRITGGAVTLVAVVLACLVGADTVAAHEKWFIDAENYPLRFNLLFQPLLLAFILAVVLATAAAAWLWRQRGGRDFVPGPRFLGRRLSA